MSDTPETDEQINGKPCTRFAVMAGDSLRDAMVPSEFARKLERERNDLLRRLTDLEHSMPIELARLESERDDARRLAERYRNLSCEDQDEADQTILPWENAKCAGTDASDKTL